jgi:hypothetical protein
VVSFGVINEGVVDYDPPYKNELLVSIFILEHEGYDERLKEQMKIIRSLLLNSDCKLVVTLRLGQNIEMDRLIAKKMLQNLIEVELTI